MVEHLAAVRAGLDELVRIQRRQELPALQAQKKRGSGWIELPLSSPANPAPRDSGEGGAGAEDNPVREGDRTYVWNTKTGETAWAMP